MTHDKSLNHLYLPCRWQRRKTGVPFDVRGQTRVVRMRRVSTGQLTDTRPRGCAHPQTTGRSPGLANDGCETRRIRVRRRCRRWGKQRRLLPVVSTKHNIKYINEEKNVYLRNLHWLVKNRRMMGAFKNIQRVFRKELINLEVATKNEIFPFSYCVGDICRQILINWWYDFLKTWIEKYLCTTQMF